MCERNFALTKWNISFSFRLISWTGRKIDPVGVDYILQKLGFHHARTTIPKWLQRGVMDPLDKVLSVLIKKLGTALQDEKDKKGRDKEEHWGPLIHTTAIKAVQKSSAGHKHCNLLYYNGHYCTTHLSTFYLLHPGKFGIVVYCGTQPQATAWSILHQCYFLYILNKVDDVGIILLL